jgi:hypothetical protein
MTTAICARPLATNQLWFGLARALADAPTVLRFNWFVSVVLLHVSRTSYSTSDDAREARHLRLATHLQ